MPDSGGDAQPDDRAKVDHLSPEVWRAPWLVVVEPGSDASLYRRKFFLVSVSPFTIGRAATNSLVCASQSASRHHASLVSREDGWYVQDASSSNGTLVDGTKSAESKLQTGSCVRVGDVVYKFIAAVDRTAKQRVLAGEVDPDSASETAVEAFSPASAPAETPTAVGASGALAESLDPPAFRHPTNEGTTEQTAALSAEAVSSVDFMRLVPYRLRWAKVMNFEFTLRWEDTDPATPQQFTLTGRELYGQLIHGTATWGLGGISLGSKHAFFCRPLGRLGDDAAERVLETMTESFLQNREAKDLEDLHVALTNNTSAVFYFLEHRGWIGNTPALLSTYAFFGIMHWQGRTTVRDYTFTCCRSCLEAFFETYSGDKPVLDDATVARAVLNYRDFFRTDPSMRGHPVEPLPPDKATARAKLNESMRSLLRGER